MHFYFCAFYYFGDKYQKELNGINKVTFNDQRRGAPVTFSDKDKIEKITSFMRNYKIAFTLPETESGWLYNVAFCKDNNVIINIYYSGKITINGVAYRITNGYNQEEFDSFMHSLIDN